MLNIPQTVFAQYTSVLEKYKIDIARFADYKKWLRYYCDFCDKYPVPDDKAECVRMFCEKLREKKQTEQQRQHAAHAVSLYFVMQRLGEPEIPHQITSPREFAGVKGDKIACVTERHRLPPDLPLSSGVEKSIVCESGEQRALSRGPGGTHQQQSRVSRGSSHYCEAGYEEKTNSPEWDAVLEALAGEIKVRHYSRKTLKTYAQWSRRFQRFLRNKPPQELSTVDVKEYLTYLAVKCNVAASTQNQAFNSLLFLYRHALKREFGEMRDVPRAKKSLYIPMVLSRPEIDAILNQLSHPFNLIVSMLFGCGLRLFEGCNCGCGTSILMKACLRYMVREKRTGTCRSRRR
jgi:hypothetical protein